MKSLKQLLFTLVAISLSSALYSAEVDKEKIPAEHLDPTLKKLPWNVSIWDVEDAIPALLENKPVLWVDTRTASFLKQGSVAGSINLVYDKTGVTIPETETILTKDTLEAAIKASKLDRSQLIIAFFCQGPKCHRSYNVTYKAVTEWGYKPEQIVWFRDGFPVLENKVSQDAKLKRKAKKLLTPDAIKNLN